jgi:hypothetical protein
MEGRWQPRTAKGRCPTARFEKRQTVVPADFSGDASLLVKVQEIGATTQKDVLAVIDGLARAGMLVGGSAAAEIRTALEESNPVAGAGKSASRGQSGEAAADDGDCRG